MGISDNELTDKQLESKLYFSYERFARDDTLRVTMISLRENDDMIAPKLAAGNHRARSAHRLRSNHRLAEPIITEKNSP